VLEDIPGEDDELAAPESAELPELPEDAEELGRERGRKRRRRRSRRGRTGLDEPGEETVDLEPAPQAAVPNKILVNAADREETRVAMVQEGRIVDFSMTIKRQSSLVNDIYRGKVVNLEPAIGAAFIDFGQGRNGFLHTSDVLTAYGDEDWSLDKLLTTKVDLDDWDDEPGKSEAQDDARGDAPGALGAPEVAVEAPTEGHDGHELDGALAAGAIDGPEDPADADSEEGEREVQEAEPAEAEVAEAESERRPRGGRREVRGGRRGANWHRPRPRLPITDLLEKGQSVVVQVTKEAIGDKGPTLTTYISIPGRYLVLMPSMARTGVSRKIEDEKERRRLKRILEELEIPSGMGVIVRTAGVGATKADIKRDLDYLLLLWESFKKRLGLGRGPAPLYEESDVAIRTIRDLFDAGTEAVIVDDPRVYERVREFTAKLMPEKLDRIQLYEGPRPLFNQQGVEQDFEKIFARRVDLPSGGSIVFDQTEALVAIDVNSGKTRSDGFDFEQIALKTNLDAVPEIARQIRLRDLGGIIVCDFIDMQRQSNRRAVERALRTALASDRARSKIGRISQFGLLELTRQRLGPGLSKLLFQNCPRCRGSGKLRTVESKTGAILRRLGSVLSLKGFSKVEVRTQPETIAYLKRAYGEELRELERKHEREITLIEVPDQIEDSVLRYLRADGREVRPGGRRKR
jgi:ribonuclease E